MLIIALGIKFVDLREEILIHGHKKILSTRESTKGMNKIGLVIRTHPTARALIKEGRVQIPCQILSTVRQIPAILQTHII